MPTYEYQCGTCNHRFEKFQSFNDEPLKTCPECGNAVKKVFSAAGVIFKGSGWYINDSRKSTSSTTPSSESAKSSPASETTKSESTSAGSTATTSETSGPAKTEAA